MNESTQIQLKIIVERAVRPVRASTSLQRAMREELLAHVSGVFAEELAQIGDEGSALERTALRFGDAAEVTSQLQESVPASDGIWRFWEGRPDETTLRGALRVAWVTGALFLVTSFVVLFATEFVSASLRDELIGALFGFAILPLWLFGIALVTKWMEPSLHGPAPLLDWPRVAMKEWIPAAWATPAVRVGLIADVVCFIPLLCILGANWQVEDWDHWTVVPVLALWAGSCAGASVFCAWVLVQSADARRHYREEWAKLPIEPSA